MELTACPETVANAAPAAPILKNPTSRKSKITFTTHAIPTNIIGNFEFPNPL